MRLCITIQFNCLLLVKTNFSAISYFLCRTLQSTEKILRITLYFGPQKLNRISEITQKVQYFGTTEFILKPSVHQKSSWPTGWPWRAHRPRVCTRVFQKRAQSVVLEQVCQGGNVNSAFPHFSPGEGGERRYQQLFCLMWCLLDALAMWCAAFTFLLRVLSLQHILFPQLYFHSFVKSTACLVYEYHWLMCYHLLLFKLL